MKPIDFSEFIAIVAKGERSHTRFQWELGDALIRHVGRPPKGVDGESAKDGSYAKLELCSEALKKAGYDYEPMSLRNYRSLSARFPVDSRVPTATWHAHLMAGTPDTLQTIIAGAPRSQKITAVYVQTIVRAMALARRQEIAAADALRLKELAAAQAELEEAEAEERRATSPGARKAAGERKKATPPILSPAARALEQDGSPGSFLPRRCRCGIGHYEALEGLHHLLHASGTRGGPSRRARGTRGLFVSSAPSIGERGA